jgi:YbgC/YbaW family acyl-CoA thioester hydrolase
MAFQFTTTRRIEFAETDMAGIVHFANFYRYMEETEHEFFRSLGLSIMWKQDDETTIGWPRVSASCSFEATARFEEILEVRLRIERKGLKSLTMSFEFHRGETRIARGEMKTVCCLLEHGEPIRSIEIPPFIGEKIEEVPDVE